MGVYAQTNRMTTACQQAHKMNQPHVCKIRQDDDGNSTQVHNLYAYSCSQAAHKTGGDQGVGGMNCAYVCNHSAEHGSGSRTASSGMASNMMSRA